MTKADSVHSTPPLNTSALPDGLARQERERVCVQRRLGKLRGKAEAEIERLISFLDASDPYVITEREEEDEREDGADAEPSLGSFDRMSDQIKAWTHQAGRAEYDTELDRADAEPSLGASAAEEQISQERWGQGVRDDREGDTAAFYGFDGDAA